MRLKNVGIGAVIFLVVLVVAYAVGSTMKSNVQQTMNQQTMTQPSGFSILSDSVKLGASQQEAFKAKTTLASWDELTRNNDNYVGKVVHFRGVVLHDYPTNGIYVMYVIVDEKRDGLYVVYTGKLALEGDIVEFWGTVQNLIKYRDFLGWGNTDPVIEAAILNVIKKEGS